MKAFVEAIEARGLDLHGVAVVRGGIPEASHYWAPYRPEARHVLYSLTKTFTALGVLFAVQEGALGLDDPVAGFFTRQVPRPAEGWKDVRVRHLLTMTLGLDADPTNEVVPHRDWVTAVLGRPLDHAPGTRFVYNNMASYLASAVVEAAVGTRLRDWLLPRLFGPLGIDDPPWDTCPRGRTIGGWGLYLTLDEVTRLGRLLGAGGVWEGTRLLDADLVAQAVRAHVATGDNPDHDGHQGYGFQIWRCRHGAFRADGAFGQLCVVRPDLDLVVAVQAGVADAQPVLDLVWKHLGGPGPVRPLGTPGTRQPPAVAQPEACDRSFDGWAGRSWALQDHPAGWKTVGFDRTPSGPVFWYVDDRGTHRAPWGWGQWVESLSGLWRHDSQRRRRFVTLASGDLTDHRLTLTLRFPEQAPVVTLTFDRDPGGLALSQHLSVTLQPSNFSGVRGVPC